MERILDENEKLRRAEEIYLKRNNKNISLLQDSKAKTKKYFESKILLNLLVLFNIAVVIFCIQNKDYIFTKDFLSRCNQYNVNISEQINKIIKKFLVEEEFEENNKVIEKSIDNNTIEDSETQKQIVNQENENKGNVETSSLSEMDLDVENLKKIYKFVNPLEGVVSSGFGARESEYQNVTGYHKGIDLAAEKGASIKAAMQGIVELVSSEGDYRETY